MHYRSNKPWEEHEKYQLWISYQLHSPFKVMEKYFNRSASGINKYLSRSGIRVACQTFQKAKKDIPKIKSLKQLHKIIILCGLDKETIGLERRHTRKWRPSQSTLSALQLYGISGPAPWKRKQPKKCLPIKSEVGKISKRTPWVYVSLEVIIHYLLRHGYAIYRIPPRNPCGWTHSINNTPVNDSDYYEKQTF